MEKLDPNLEAQVWRRIAGESRIERGDLRPLLLMAWEQASALRHLTGLLQGKQRERMRGLAEKAQRSVNTLKGLLMLSGQEVGKLRPVPIPKETARRLLEKSFHRSRHLMAEYIARGIDPEFGAVYQGLGEWEGENGMMMAEILGGMER